MNYSDNQTRHFYVIANSDGVIKQPANSDKFRLKFYEGGYSSSNNTITATSDVISKNSIKNLTVSTPDAYIPKEWNIYVTDGTTVGDVREDAKYKIQFLAENILNMGQQSRMARTIMVKTEKNPTDDALYIALAKECYNQILGNVSLLNSNSNNIKTGPINDEVEIGITYNGNFINVEDFTSSTTAAECLTIRQKKVDINKIKEDIITHNYPPYNINITISGECIWTTEETGDNGKKKIIYHTEYWITDSTTTTAKQYAESVDTVGTYYNGDRIYDMEHFFKRNRADRYDLNSDFYTSIINTLYAEVDKNYNCVDFTYSYGDNLGFSYRSDKNITIAVLQSDDSSFTEFDKTEEYAVGSLIKKTTLAEEESDEDVIDYYYLPEGHAANVEFNSTTKTKINVTDGFSTQIENIFK